METSTSDITRFEVIRIGEGRVLTYYGVGVEVSIQDEGRTMKVFIYDKDKNTTGNNSVDNPVEWSYKKQHESIETKGSKNGKS